MKRDVPRAVVLCCRYASTLSYYDDWEESLTSSGLLDAVLLNVADREAPDRLKRLVAETDVIVALHSTNGNSVRFLERCEPALLERKVPLIVFVGNEFNSANVDMGLREKIALLRRLRVEFIATQLPPEVGRWLYEDVPGARVASIPHGLNPERFRPVVPQTDRKVDIGVRSARYNSLLGDNDRVAIVQRFTGDFNPPLVVDINMNPDARLTGKEWAVFLNGCRGTASTEAGSSFLEKDDATVLRAAGYLRQKMSRSDRYLLSAARMGVGRLVPAWLKPGVKGLMKRVGVREAGVNDPYHAEDFREFYDLFFRDYRNPVSGKCISSRHFEAIGTQTCQIMFPGRFNDILQADRDYLALKRDFSNLDDVLSRFRDLTYRETMVNAAFARVMDAHTYRHRVQDVVRLVGG